MLSNLALPNNLSIEAILARVLRHLHRPRVGDLELSGLYVEEGYINNSYRLVSATIVLFIGTTVVRWELHTGDWNTAFALGSFLVGMVTAIATLRHL